MLERRGAQEDNENCTSHKDPVDPAQAGRERLAEELEREQDPKKAEKNGHEGGYAFHGEVFEPLRPVHAMAVDVGREGEAGGDIQHIIKVHALTLQDK